MSTEIILVRHGRTVWNVQGRPRGRAEVPLDAVGVQQAEAAAAYVAEHWSPKMVYHSPLRRTRETAVPIGKATGAPLVPHAGFIDIDFGAWEGRLPDDLAAHWSDAWRTWHTRPQEVIIPDGETLMNAQRRAMAALHEVVRANPDHVVAVVSHMHIIRLLILGILEGGLEHFWHLQQDPTAINVLHYENQDFTLVKMNLTHHL